jgi:hypothetical protein
MQFKYPPYARVYVCMLMPFLCADRTAFWNRECVCCSRVFVCLSKTDRQIDILTDRQIDRQTDRHTDRQTDRHTDRHNNKRKKQNHALYLYNINVRVYSRLGCVVQSTHAVAVYEQWITMQLLYERSDAWRLSAHTHLIRMYVYTYICVCVCMYVYFIFHVCMYIHTYTYIRIYIHGILIFM